MNRRFCCVAAAFCCACLAGCYRKTVEDGAIVYSFQPWVPLLTLVGGVVAVPVGIALYRGNNRTWGAACVILGPLAAGGLAPGMFQDHVRVDAEGFQSRHGFWFAPTVHNIRYADLDQVRVSFEEHRSLRRRRSYSYYFDCYFKSGAQERVPLGDIMRQALPEIAEQFRSHGVPVHIPPNLPD